MSFLATVLTGVRSADGNATAPLIIVVLVVLAGLIVLLCWYIRRLAEASIALQLAASEFCRSVEHRLDRQQDQIQVLQAQISRSSTRPVPS